MRREVEDDVDVVLVEAQVQPGAVDVVHLAQFPVLDKLTELAHGRVVLEGVPDHQHHPRLRRRPVQQPRARGGGGQRLFHQDVLAGLDRLQRHGHVRAWRGGHHHRVHFGKGRGEGGMPGGRLVTAGELVCPILARVDDDHFRDAFRRVQHADML